MATSKGSVRNQALAANMKQLRAGRSIGQLRAEMAKKGISIGAGTLHRAILGEDSNRLESLGKIAEFFDTTVDQLLQFEGVDETYWPFSAELQQAVLHLSDEELLKAENVLRAHLGLPQQFVTEFANSSPSQTPRSGSRQYAETTEEGEGALREAELPTPTRHARRKTTGRPAHQKGGRGA